MDKSDVIAVASAVIKKVTKSKDVKKFLCGEYLDGTTRSVADAITGEMVSPKQKRKKHKKNGKKKKKYKKQETRLFL